MALQFRRGVINDLPDPSDAAIGEPLFTTDEGKLRIKKADGTYAVIGSGTSTGELDLSGIAAGSMVKVNGAQDGFVAAAGTDLPSHTQSASTITGLATVATTGSYLNLTNRPAIPTSLSQLSGPLTLGVNAQLPSPPDPASEATLRWSPGSGWVVYQEGTSGAETVDFYSWFEPVGYSTFAAAVAGGLASGATNLATIGSFADPGTNRVITYLLPIGFWFCYFIHEDDANADDAAFGWTPAFFSPALGAPQTLSNLGRIEIDLGDGVKWHRMWRLGFAQGNASATTTVTLGVT